MSIRSPDSYQSRYGSRGKLLQRLISAERTRYAAHGDFSGLYLGAQSTGAIKFVKDLVLEVLRFPLTYREALFSGSSPVAGAAYSGYQVLDAGFSRRIQNPSRVRRRPDGLSLTKLVIPNRNRSRNPRGDFSLQL